MLKNKDGRRVCGACILPASMLKAVFPSHCFDNLEHKTKQLYFGYFSPYKYLHKKFDFYFLFLYMDPSIQLDVN